jgi:hypothetical protein
MRYLNFTAGLILGVLLALGIGSYAQVEIGTGTCQYKGLEDGVWWQSQFGFEGNLKPHCLEIQKNVPVSEHFGYSFGLAHLGNLHANNLATVADNDPYDGGSCNHATAHNCIARVRVEQATYGITGGLYASMHKFGVLWAAELGVLGYRSSFTATITQNDYGLYSYDYNTVGYHVAPYVGVAAKWKGLYARARVYEGVRGEGYQSDGVQQPGLAHGPVTSITVGMTF